MKRYVLTGILLILSAFSLAHGDSGADFVADFRAQIPAERITPDVERQIHERIQSLSVLPSSERAREVERDRVSIRSYGRRMYNMHEYYQTRKIDKPVLGYIVSHFDAIDHLLDKKDADESIATLYILMDAYFLDAYNRYSIYLDREALAREELHKETLLYLPEDTAVPLPSISNTYQSIVVDISEQRLYAYEDGMLVKSVPVTTGRRGFDTVLGDFSVKSKERGRFLNSPFDNISYRLYVDYWIQFHGDYGIHDACNSRNCWRRIFGTEDYVKKGSHGCVNTPHDGMEWLYNWALDGTGVRVQE